MSCIPLPSFIYDVVLPYLSVGGVSFLDPAPPLDAESHEGGTFGCFIPKFAAYETVPGPSDF